MNIICSVGEKYSMENSFKLVGTHYIHTLYSLPVSISDAFATLCTLRYTAIQGLRSWRRFLFKLSIHQLKHGTLHTAAHTRPTLVASHTHTHTVHTTYNTQVQLAWRVQKRKHFDFLLVAYLNLQLNGGRSAEGVWGAYGVATGIIHLTRPHVHTHTNLRLTGKFFAALVK